MRHSIEPRDKIILKVMDIHLLLKMSVNILVNYK